MKKPAKKIKTKKIDKEIYVNDVYNDVLDQVEKSSGISSEDITDVRISTGILSIDLILGGGMRNNGMVTWSGMETSGKTTHLTETMREIIKLKVPIISLDDAEQATDPNYTGNILHAKLDTILGKKIDGKWVIPPKIRYYDESLMGVVFNRWLKLLNRIPDKTFIPNLDQWFLVVDPKDKRLNNFNEKTLGDYNSKLSSKEKLWFPCDNANPQAFLAIDCWSSLVPDVDDEDEDDASKALAVYAREYAKHSPRIMGKLRRKKVLLAGTNQIKENPGARFTDSRYESGGNKLRSDSHVRNWFASLSVPDKWRDNSGKAAYMEEPSVEGKGVDRYMFKKITNKKNKWGRPFGETWSRIWVSDYKANGRGVDAAFDTFNMLAEVGLATRLQKKTVKFAKTDWPLSNLSVDWLEFKILILAEEYKDKELVAKAGQVYKRLKLSKPFYIRKFCRQFLLSGKAKTAAEEMKNNKAKDFSDDLEMDSSSGRKIY